LARVDRIDQAVRGCQAGWGCRARRGWRAGGGRGAGRALVPVSVLALVELFAFTMKSIGDYPTLSLLADPILAGYLPRAVCYFAWLAGFWGLIRR
jgi:hypothetical protein